MPSALDREVSSPDKSAFGHRHFADALRGLIESETYAPPFSIGLLGGWGTGKSTIKALYISALIDDAQKIDGKTRSERIHTITFNAWRFGGKDQDIKRALLRHVFLELGGDDESLRDRLFRQTSETREESKLWYDYTLELIKAWVKPLPAFLLSLALLLGFLVLTLWLLPIQNDLARSLIVVAVTGAFSYLFKQIQSPPVSAHRFVTRITLPSTTAYEDLLLDQIAKFKSGKSRTPLHKSGKACKRLVVFVDDLDRLSAEEMVLGLDAVRTFMEIPKTRLPGDLGVVFVISCDESKVADALSKGRRQSDLPGTVFTHTDARRYLDRIFQFRLEIPPFPRQDMREYALKQADKNKLALDNPVEQFVPNTPDAWSKVTVRHLLNRRSGIPPPAGLDEFPKGVATPYTPQELVDVFLPKSLKFEPGSKFEYSNSGYYVLGYIIERVSGQTYATYLKEHIFAPLGMSASGFDSVEDVIPNRATGYSRDGGSLKHAMFVDWTIAYSAGGLYSTVGDMLAWDRGIETLLGPVAYRSLAQPKGQGYNFGWFVTRDDEGRLRMHHEGSNPGFGAYVIRYPEQGLFIVILSNLEGAPVSRLGESLAELAIAKLLN